MLPYDLPLEPLVYTPEEWDAMCRSGNRFATGVLACGVRL